MDENLKYRLLKALSALFVAASIGTIGFWINEGGEATIGECLYMTIITLSTVGYGEVFELDTSGRIFASFLIILGMGTLIYFGSTVVSLWVDLDMRQVRRRKRMQKAISNWGKHIIGDATERATLIVLGNVDSVIRLRQSVDKSDGRYTVIK